MLTIPPTTHGRKRRRRKTSPFDVAYPKLIEKMDGQMVAEEYFEVWEFANSVARLANKVSVRPETWIDFNEPSLFFIYFRWIEKVDWHASKKS